MPNSNPYLQDLPTFISDKNVILFNKFFNGGFFLCDGNPHFVDVIQSRLEVNQPFMSVDNPVAYVEDLHHVTLPSADDYKCVRHKDCLFFVLFHGAMCEKCSDYSHYLRTCRSRLEGKIAPEAREKRV